MSVDSTKKSLSKINKLSTLLQEVAQEIPHLTQIDLNGEEIIDPFIVSALSPHLCRLTKMIIPGTISHFCLFFLSF